MEMYLLYGCHIEKIRYLIFTYTTFDQATPALIYKTLNLENGKSSRLSSSCRNLRHFCLLEGWFIWVWISLFLIVFGVKLPFCRNVLVGDYTWREKKNSASRLCNHNRTSSCDCHHKYSWQLLVSTYHCRPSQSPDKYFYQDIVCLKIDPTILLIASTEGFASAMGNSLLKNVPSSR
jgi:hypothetical protein